MTVRWLFVVTILFVADDMSWFSKIKQPCIPRDLLVTGLRVPVSL